MQLSGLPAWVTSGRSNPPSGGLPLPTAFADRKPLSQPRPSATPPAILADDALAARLTPPPIATAADVPKPLRRYSVDTYDAGPRTPTHS